MNWCDNSKQHMSAHTNCGRFEVTALQISIIFHISNQVIKAINKSWFLICISVQMNSFIRLAMCVMWFKPTRLPLPLPSLSPASQIQILCFRSNIFWTSSRNLLRILVTFCWNLHSLFAWINEYALWKHS